MAIETTEVIQRESPEVEAYKLALMEMAKNLASKPPQGGIPDFELAGFDEAQTKAYNQIMNNVGNYQGTLNKGIGSLDEAEKAFQASRGEFDPETISKYFNPFERDVVQTLEKDALKQNAMLLNQGNLGSAGAGAFGGGRNAIMQAQTSADTADRLAGQTADLRYRGYGDASKMALGAFEGARGRDLSAGTALAGLGGQYGGIAGLEQDLNFKDANAMYEMGARKQAQSQAQKDVARKNILQGQQEPYQRLGFLSDIFQGAPSTTMQYTTSPSTAPSFLNQLVGTGITGLGLYGAGKNIFS